MGRFGVCSGEAHGTRRSPVINQVVLAGRLTKNPTQVGVSRVELVLEVEHTPWEGPEEACELRVRVESQRQCENALKFLEAERNVIVEGHLRVDQDDWYVACRRWAFLERGIERRCLWDPALVSAPSAASAGIQF